MSRLFTIDFEASCLPRHGRSFPIEVGISEVGGSTMSWLIRPHPDWREWTWTKEAEALHKVTLGQLERDGLPVDQVMQQLTRALGRSRVVADSNLDSYWMDTLARAAGQPAPIIETVHSVIDEIGTTAREVEQAEAEEAARPSRRHHAGEDAARLGRLLSSLIRQADIRARDIWSMNLQSPGNRDAREQRIAA